MPCLLPSNILPIRFILLRFASVDFCCLQSKKYYWYSLLLKDAWLRKRQYIVVFLCFVSFCPYPNVWWVLYRFEIYLKNWLPSNLTNSCSLAEEIETRSCESSYLYLEKYLQDRPQIPRYLPMTHFSFQKSCFGLLMDYHFVKNSSPWDVVAVGPPVPSCTCILVPLISVTGAGI